MWVLKRLFLFLAPYKRTLIVSVLLLVGRAGLELVPPLFQRSIVDEVIGNRDVARLGLFVGLLVATYALQQGVNAGDMFIRHALGERFILDLRVRIYAYLQRLSLSFFERTSTGELMSRVTNDVAALESFVTHGSALSAVDLLRLVGGAIILFVLDVRLAALVLLPVPILAISLRYFNTRIRPVYRRVRARLGDINARLQDSLSGIQVIQAFVQEEHPLLGRVLSGYAVRRVAGHGHCARGGCDDGRAGPTDAGHAGCVPVVHHFLLRAYQPPDRSG
jgi:ABC-type multidrug transport system fused ATPase/permease subunit